MDTRDRCLPVRKELPLQISKLDGYHAELVDACLPYGGSQESLNHARVCSCHLPNRCVTDEKGWCVSWILSNEQCELMPAYTSSDTGHLQALSPVGMRTITQEGYHPPGTPPRRCAVPLLIASLF
ncbi:uncharacterized protein LOC143414279 [Maylandia zebra]|uniref:uncharacterized protein LOC143414279 n=1 Tax=Maylandia zebra TaxID=106582 RepID=UPI00403C2408